MIETFATTDEIASIYFSDSGAQYQEGGGDLPAYMEDFFQRIVNVNWAGALAVEFFDGAA